MRLKRRRLDFLEHRSGIGWIAFLNGSPLCDQFATIGEIVTFAQLLRTPARYAGTDVSRVEAEGWYVVADEEREVMPREAS
jgi:hypothetical protein